MNIHTYTYTCRHAYNTIANNWGLINCQCRPWVVLSCIIRVRLLFLFTSFIYEQLLLLEHVLRIVYCLGMFMNLYQICLFIEHSRKMSFMSEQNAFILKAHYRNGIRRENNDKRSYSLQSCTEQFRKEYPDYVFAYKFSPQHWDRIIIDGIENKNCKGKTSGRL